MRAVCSAWRSSLWVLALRLPGRQSPCEGTGKAGRGGTGERVRFCGALLLELVLALVLRCCRARHTLNCVVDPCVGSGAQRRRPNCAGHAVRAARVPLEVVCGAGCAMQLWAVGVWGRAETPSCGRRGEMRAVRPCTASPATTPPPLCVYVRHTTRRRLWVCSLRGG